VVLEDIQNTVQRPKCEEYEDFSFLVFRMLRRADTGQPIGRGGMSGRIESEQISLLLGENYVISFQERPGDVFGHVRNRIRSGKGRVRRQGADYLAYVLMDLVVDGYLLLLEDIEEELEDLEDLLDERRTAEIPGRLRHAKAELVDVRRAVRPLREVVELLLKEESTHFREETEPYLRDLGDHTHRAIDTVELLKEMQSIVGGSYQAALSNDMNSVMKVLTIIATIFIPLTFVAGIYGMNFRHMPELSLPWAYPAVLGVMGAIVVGMLIYFRRKGWL
jgi:magnesium transporter